MDGLEPVKKFTETLKERGYHKRVLHQAVGVDDPVDAPDSMYRVFVISGPNADNFPVPAVLCIVHMFA